MSDKTYRVFLSSTYRDNKERRKELFNAILGIGMMPVGMEAFTSSSRPTVEECLRLVSDCDIFVGILAWRYGWKPKDQDKSITELEYETAGSAKVPRLMFIIEGGEFPPDMQNDTDEGDFDTKFDQLKRLNKFKARVQEGREGMPTSFEDRSLSRKVVTALEDWRREQNRPEQNAEAASTIFGEAENLNFVPDRILAEYFEAIKQRHSYLDFVGFESQIRVPFRLEDLHVELSASYNLQHCELIYPDAAEAERMLGEHERTRTFPLRDLFRCKVPGPDRDLQPSYDGFVLLGDPGSGKTTHLRRLALLIASGQATELGLPAETIPIFLPLRELAEHQADFQTFVCDQLRIQHPQAKDMESLIQHRCLLFLIDGLDEVPELNRRSQVSNWIKKLHGLFTQSRAVLTCRYAGYNDEVRLPPRFLEVHLRPLSRESAEAFIHNWYRVVETSLADGESSSEPLTPEERSRHRAQELCQRLAQGEYRTARMAELARNPLLLTTLCLVHRDRGGLPQQRHKLYEECIVLLLELWNKKARELRVTFSADDARALLQPMAYWLHGQLERTRASAEELEPVLAPHLGRLGPRGESEAPAITASQFLETIKNESGILTGWSAEHFGFLHLGFQEYLAAQEIRNRFIKDPKVLDELALHFGKSWWREVTSLLVALENPSLAQSFFERLVELPQFAEHPDLVEGCLEDAAEVESEPFERVLAAVPGEDEGLWARQLAALRVMQRVAPEQVEKLSGQLRDHPLEAIRELVGGARAKGTGERIVAHRGGYELIRIPGGTFLMRESEGRYEVTLDDFYLGIHPVTNAQYERYMRENPKVEEPEYWSDRRFNGAQQPVVGISWHEAQAYCKWAGDLRLPTEAQWEYACRAGTTTAYWSGDKEADLARVAWYRRNSEDRTHPVGEKPANPFGLHDMHGNVFEWCRDCWGEVAILPRTGDGLRAAERDMESAELRVLRGGCWGLPAVKCRSVSSYAASSQYRNVYFGFRPTRVIT